MSPGRERGMDGGVDGEPDAPAVRPYTVTGGRTRSASGVVLPFEALVEATGPVEASRLPEARAILSATDQDYLSIAELSARLGQPIGVVRVLVGDLLDAGLVRVHGVRGPLRAGPADDASRVATDRDEARRVLERVLDGIAAL